MALSKRVVLSQMEVLEDGTIQVRLDKQIVEDDQILAREYHRTAIEPGVDVDAQMNAVDSHLKAMGYPAFGKAGRERVKRIAELEHTPAVVKAYRKAQAAVRAEAAAAEA